MNFRNGTLGKPLYFDELSKKFKKHCFVGILSSIFFADNYNINILWLTKIINFFFKEMSLLFLANDNLMT